MLKEIKFIQSVGRFETAKPLPGVAFGHCTLLFGENGWGKSTLADILRSLSTNNPAILAGRATLDAQSPPKVILRFGTQNAIFDNGAWTGLRPRIAVYDSAFINDNVYSGDIVSPDHLKNQYGLVVGEEGVRRVRRIVELDGENRDNNKSITETENELKVLMRSFAPSAMQMDAFLALAQRPAIDEAIEAQDLKVQQARRAKELKAAPEPAPFPVPTETERFADLFRKSIDDVAADAVAKVRAHIAAHERRDGESDTPHESWLETGMAFAASDDCPFCGQHLDDRSLVDAYKDVFSDAYKQLAHAVKTACATLDRYRNKEFRQAVERAHEQNERQFQFWHEAGRIALPAIGAPEQAIATLEQAADDLLALFAEKQADLTAAISEDRYADALGNWEQGRQNIAGMNAAVADFLRQVKELKDRLDPAQLPALENELKTLHAQKRRHDADIVTLVGKLDAFKRKKKDIADEKARIKAELNDHGRAITTDLGKAINAYLKRLNAGFRIDYREPDYRGKEPSASYDILIREVPVSPRSGAGEIDKPCFRNTLSAGDKSTLALAFFLAQVNADPKLSESIVVLDDPFTSLDHFRRQFTAIEIRKLCGQALQLIVLSHEKTFLRLLWDKIDQDTIASLALQTGAPGITTIAPFDIATATQPRYVTERVLLEEFIEGEQHDANHIRTRLRTVCEDFYRKGDQQLFSRTENLEGIIRKLEAAPEDHVYKAALDDLRSINEYSRGDNHAEIPDNPSEELSIEELKHFCRLVIDLTRGM